MLHVSLLFLFLPFVFSIFSIHLLEKVEKSYFFSYFCIFFWSQFTKNTYTLNDVPILRLKSRMKLLHFYFENSLLDRFLTFFRLDVCVNITRKYWENSLNFDKPLRHFTRSFANFHPTFSTAQHLRIKAVFSLITTLHST